MALTIASSRRQKAARLMRNVRFQERFVSMYTLSQFQINEAWIAFKLNDAPISTQEDGDFNVVALMDAASCFILGMEFVSVDSPEPSQLESRRLLKGGQSHKNQLPEKLLIPREMTANLLAEESERLGIAVARIAENELLVFLDEAREGFQEHVSGGRIQ